MPAGLHSLKLDGEGHLIKFPKKQRYNMYVTVSGGQKAVNEAADLQKVHEHSRGCQVLRERALGHHKIKRLWRSKDCKRGSGHPSTRPRPSQVREHSQECQVFREHARGRQVVNEHGCGGQEDCKRGRGGHI